ncbi:MAG TPA: hypothetical protein VHI52_11810, partial [Verrucomicrobiae bacterium]|nr:hypothetical protein [Verrucomicrobiae bacterium]
RVYVGGLSSGARLACMIGISCGDIFSGTLCVCGVNFYLNLPAGGNLYFPSSFSPAADVLAFARAHAKYVLVTGENDPDSETIKLVATRGFLREGFKQVLLLDIPGLQQALPGLGPLGQALGFLGETQIPSAVPAAKTPVSSKPRNPHPAASPTPDKPPASAGRAE